MAASTITLRGPAAAQAETIATQKSKAYLAGEVPFSCVHLGTKTQATSPNMYRRHFGESTSNIAYGATH